MTEETNSPIIFISYSHDDDAHRERVLGIAERLQADGYKTHLDQYVNGTPTEGWPRWMLDRLDEATHVLCVCTETYYRRFRGHELPGRGKGGDWEGALITQELYDARSHNTRFIPIFVADANQDHIPEPLRPATHYILTSDAAYQALLDQIEQTAGVEPSPLGVRRPRTRRRGRPAEFPDAPGTAPTAAAGLPPIHNIVLPRNPDFTGRQAALEALEQTFAAGEAAAVTQAVHGGGGVGKTQLALEYLYRHAGDYDVAWWVPCEQPETARGTLAELAVALGLSNQAASDLPAAAAAARTWLGGHGRWLLILDNVEQPAAVAELLPAARRGHILITSRNPNFTGVAKPLSLDVFSRSESLDYLAEALPEGVGSLFAASSEKTPDPLDALANQLGDLPLALAQAAAYIVETGITVADYSRLFAARHTDLWANSSPPAGYQRTVAETFSLAMDRVRDQSPPAETLMNQLAYLAPEPIPAALLAATMDDEIQRHEVVAVLRSFALLTGGGASHTVHRLVQLVCRDRQSPEAASVSAAAAIRAVNGALTGHPIDDIHLWPLYESLRPHGLAAIEHADRLTAARSPGKAFPPFWESDTIARVLNGIGLYLNNRADFAAAEPLIRRAIDILENSVAGIKGSEPSANAPAGGSVPSPPVTHPHLGIYLNNLAALLRDTNRVAEAEPLMRRALAIDEQSYGAEHPQVAIDLNNLAALLHDTNRLAEAEPLMWRALAIDEQSYGAEHPNVATRLNNLAQLLQATNRLAEAEPLMRRALAIDEQSYGAEHPNVAIHLNNLATLLQATNRLAEAKPLMHRALAIGEQSYGAEHPRFAALLNNLVVLLQSTNQLAEAEPMMRRVLAIDEQVYGAEHSTVARDLNNLATLLRAANRLAEAEPLMRRMVKILVKFGETTGYEHPHLQTALHNYSRLLAAMNLSESEIAIRLDEVRTK